MYSRNDKMVGIALRKVGLQRNVGFLYSELSGQKHTERVGLCSLSGCSNHQQGGGLCMKKEDDRKGAGQDEKAR